MAEYALWAYGHYSLHLRSRLAILLFGIVLSLCGLLAAAALLRASSIFIGFPSQRTWANAGYASVGLLGATPLVAYFVVLLVTRFVNG